MVKSILDKLVNQKPSEKEYVLTILNRSLQRNKCDDKDAYEFHGSYCKGRVDVDYKESKTKECTFSIL